MASCGIDARTGRVLRDSSHVDQSLRKILATEFGQRFMRRFNGSQVPRLLGENMDQVTFLRFFSAVGVALLQEPRLALIQIVPLSVERDGSAGFRIEFEDRPRGHLGDFTPAGRRRVLITATDRNFQGFTIAPEA